MIRKIIARALFGSTITDLQSKVDEVDLAVLKLISNEKEDRDIFVFENGDFSYFKYRAKRVVFFANETESERNSWVYSDTGVLGFIGESQSGVRIGTIFDVITLLVGEREFTIEEEVKEKVFLNLKKEDTGNHIAPFNLPIDWKLGDEYTIYPRYKDFNYGRKTNCSFNVRSGTSIIFMDSEHNKISEGKEKNNLISIPKNSHSFMVTGCTSLK